MSQESPIPIDGFEIHAVYGFKLTPASGAKGSDGPGDASVDWDSLVKKVKEVKEDTPHVHRASWSPTYRNSKHTITVSNTNSQPRCVTLHKPPNWTDVTMSPFKLEWGWAVTLRSDGMGTLSLRMKPAQPSGETLGVGHILSVMALTPRFIDGLTLGRYSDNDALKGAHWVSYVEEPPAGGEFSSLIEGCEASGLYRMYLESLSEFCEPLEGHFTWNEFEAQATAEARLSDRSFPLQGDPQVPYFFVLADTPSEFYEQYSAEFSGNLTHGDNSAANKAIGAILERWLSPTLIGDLSEQYLEKSNLLYNGRVYSKYRNIHSFISFNEAAALCLRKTQSVPSAPMGLCVQEATYGSLLSCIELARLRWHHALHLSRELDRLAAEVSAATSLRAIMEHIKRIAGLRAHAVTHMIDPLTHLWDASVGTDMAKYFQETALEQIDRDTMEKFDAVKQLVADKYDALRVADVINARASDGV